MTRTNREVYHEFLFLLFRCFLHELRLIIALPSEPARRARRLRPRARAGAARLARPDAAAAKPKSRSAILLLQQRAWSGSLAMPSSGTESTVRVLERRARAAGKVGP